MRINISTKELEDSRLGSLRDMLEELKACLHPGAVVFVDFGNKYRKVGLTLRRSGFTTETLEFVKAAAKTHLEMQVDLAELLGNEPRVWLR